MSEKINWSTKRDEWAEAMEPVVLWDKGTDAQQELADSLINQFCKRFAKYLSWACKDELIAIEEADSLCDEIWTSIFNIDDARWWCNKKYEDDIKIAMKLTDDEDYKKILKTIKKKYSL